MESGCRLCETSGASADAPLDCRGFLDVLKDGVLVQDVATGAILDANRAARHLYGLTGDQLRASSIEALSEGRSPYGGEDALVHIRRAARGEPQTFEWRARHASGALFWVEVSLNLVRGARGDRLVAVLRDIGARKRADEALREQQAFATRILSSSLNGLYVVDLEAELPSFVNARYTQLTGYTLDDLRAMGGDLIGRLFHPDDQPRMREHLAALAGARDGEVLDVEYRFRARDGRWISCASRETPFSRAPDGRVRQLIGTFVDVTELRETQAAVRESEARYRALFESMREGFVLYEVLLGPGGEPVDLRFLEVNPAFERLTGAPRGRVVGRRLGEASGEERDAWLRVYREAARTGAATHLEHRSAVIHRDYEVWAYSPRPLEFAALFVDITDRKRIEGELRDADRRKNEFLGVLSHELRNPLAPIRNSLDLLERAAPGGEQAARARRVLARQTEHLARLVDDLLDVTRISRGKIRLQRVPLDAIELIRRACEDHRSLFEEAGVALEAALPAEPAAVDADPTRLSQIVGNLLQNAVKFTPSGGRVTVAAARAGGRLELEVRDTGLGLSGEDLERLFEPFAQADRSLARTRGGLGLGLALVRGLVELHGGTIAVRSEGPGRGSAFTVSLPLLPAAEARPAPRWAPASARPARPAPAPAPRRVLVVDDNADAAEALAELLRVQGHQVDVALDGASSIEQARRSAPEVILCDLGLPGMSGYDVARALRAEAGPALRLIAVSGYAAPEDVQRALDAGFDAHVAKPADLGRLERLLA